MEHRMSTNRVWCVLGAAVILGLLLVACQQRPVDTEGPPTAENAIQKEPEAPMVAIAEDRNDDASQVPVTGDWVVGRLANDPPHFNILLDTADASASTLTADTFESMLDRNYETLELEPLLAESYEVSEDRLTYTFTLRKDVTFSDGVPMTAEDVLFTFDAIQNPENETADLKGYYQDVEKAEMLDPYTIRFTCKKPYYRHLIMLGGLPIFPKHVYGEGNLNQHPNNRVPVGSGPYVFESWDTNQQVTFKRNDDYWRDTDRGFLDRKVYKIISDDNAAFQVLENGDLDVMGLSTEQWVNRTDSAQFQARFRKMQYWGGGGYYGHYTYIGWNERRPMFADKRVRQAMTLLLDRQQVLDTIYHGIGRICTGPFPHYVDAYDPDIKPWPFDPERAQAQLDEAGWVDTDNDGVRDKDGVTFEFEFLMPSGVQEVEQMVTFYQEQLADVGIRMTIRRLEWATFLENLTKRQFDAVTLGWAMPPEQDPYQVWHSSGADQGSNYPAYKNEEVDRILEEARMEFDAGKRNAMYRKLHAILHEDQPYTFLFVRQALAAVDKRFRNVNTYPLGPRSREWWVPTPEQRYP